MSFYQNRNLILKGESPSIGNLWLGDYESARDKRRLKGDQINSVVTAGLGMKIIYGPEFNHKLLPLHDSESENITRFFQQSFDFIDESLKTGNVLIHCFAGVSRSTTILTAYLMRKYSWSVKQTLSLIKGKRFVISPNRGFIAQLRKFEQEIGQSKTAQSKTIESKGTLMKIKSQDKKPFLQGFLSYKRDASLSNRITPKTIFYSRKLKTQQRSKTTNKQICVSAN